LSQVISIFLLLPHQAGAPVVGIHTSHGPAHSGMRSKSAELAPAESAGWAPVMLSQMDASGVIPQLSAQLLPPGACGPAALQAVPDFSFVVSPAKQRCTGRDAESLLSCAPSSSNSGVTSALSAVMGQVCSLLGLAPACATAGLLAMLGLSNSSQGSSGAAVEPGGQHRAVWCSCCGSEKDDSSAYSGGVWCGSNAEALLRLRALLALLPSSNAAPAPAVWF
jgi:hypothetical protein